MKKYIFLGVALAMPLFVASMKRPGSFTADVPAKRVASTASCSLMATPYDDIINMIAVDINSIAPGGYVGIESPSLSNKKIVATVVEAVKKGITIKILVNNSAAENNPSLPRLYQDLKDRGIVVTEVPNLHAKRIVINKNDQDQSQIVYVGSLNMTDNSPYNHEMMMRCADAALFAQSYQSQQQVGQAATHFPALDVSVRNLVSSAHPESQALQKRVIEEFATCSTHPHDFLYVVAYTLDDKEIVDAIIRANKQVAEKGRPIKVILDGSSWPKHAVSILRPLVFADVDVFIFNKNKSHKTPAGHPKSMHIKALLRQCNQKCFSLFSTANFTPTGKQDINYDVWEPCSLVTADKFKKILDTIIKESEKLKKSDFKSGPEDGTPADRGKKLSELLRYKTKAFENTDEILRLIGLGADLSLTDDYQFFAWTVLMRAASHNHLEVLKALLAAGADVNFVTDEVSALLVASMNGNAEAVKLLLEAGADANKTVADNSPLLAAASNGDLNTVQVLIETGIAPTLNFADEFGRTPLYRALQGGHVEVVKALLKIGADTEKQGDYQEKRQYYPAGGIPPLVQAVARNNGAIVQALLGAGANINARDRDGKTALMRSVELNYLPITKILLSAGADLELKDRFGKSAFEYAVGKPKMLTLLNEVKFVRENAQQFLAD